MAFVWFQASLLDAGLAAPTFRPIRSGVRRRMLSRGAWLDVLPGWLAGADELFIRLQRDVPWKSEQRVMYERTVDVPRLVCSYGVGQPLADPLLEQARDALTAHYAPELGEPFVTAGLCHYRDGRDSVAWHGDRIGRGRAQNTMVAILSLGAQRKLSLRPRVPEVPSGGEAIAVPLGHGDLVVMGGTCQRTWDHAVLKTAKPVGPRISVQFRPLNVL